MTFRENNARPKRETRKKDDKRDLLENIKRSKNSGFNFKQNIVVEDVYDYVDEDSYNKLREKRQLDDFIEGGYDDGREMFDESSGEDERVENSLKRKKSHKNPNLKKSKLDFSGVKSTGKTIDPFNKLNMKSQKKCIPDDMDDLLNELCSQIPESQNVEYQNPYLNTNTKPKFDIHKPKLVTNKPNENKLLNSENKTKTNNSSAIHKSHDKQNETKIIVKEIVNKEHVIVETNTKSFENSSSVVDESNLMDFDDVDFDDIDFDEPFEEVEKSFSNQAVAKQVESVWLKEENICEELVPETYSNIGKGDCKQIFWFDAYHDKKIAGTVFLFGKTFDPNEKALINCCVRIHGLERRLYFLPKNNYGLQDVYNELMTTFSKNNIASFRAKPVMRKYAFQLPDVPQETEYLMVLYDSKYPELPDNFTGETFSHVFGTNTSCLENLILDLKLKGPCWLSFESLETVHNQFSTCKRDFQIQGIKGINKIHEKAPRFTVLSLNIKTITNRKTNTNEIVSVGGMIHNDVSFDQAPNKIFQKSFAIITHPKDNVMPYDTKQKLQSEWGVKFKESVTIEPNERSLINNLLAKLQRLDPDLIVGHSMFGYQLEILLQRCQALNLNHWHRLGRLKRNIALPKVSGKSLSWLERMATAGRIICDTSVSARELVKCRSYELYDLVKEILPDKFDKCPKYHSIGDLNKLFLNSSGIKQLIDMTMDEAIYNLYLMHELQILPLALEITSICGNLLSRTLSGGKSERNEYLLLHAFIEKDYIVPNKSHQISSIDNKISIENDDDVANNNDNGGNYSKRKPTYSGGLVLDPKKGFYENFILLMDFNSLYPSIIQEFNICFTTIDRLKYITESGDNMIGEQEMIDLSNEAALKPQGILPNEIRKLVDSRTAVKRELLNSNLTPERRMQLDIRQKALKITANSIYGCLGFSHSRFKATHLAALVTFHGRTILHQTKNLVSSGSINVNKIPGLNKHNITLDIIYGDTDSIMVNTTISNVSEYDHVLKIGHRIKDEVNKMYKNIKLDIDGVFRKMLLLNKKKYAALVVVKKNPINGQLITKQELKGLDLVRRDWCKLSVEVGKNVLTKILEGDMSQEVLAESIHNYLEQISDDVKNSRVDLDKFVITKALARNPESYSNVQGQPHVQVALRLNNMASVKHFRAKDTVEYVICNDGSTENATQRAYSPSEVINSSRNNSNKLVIDCNYYLAHQLHPVITRLVDLIESMNPATIAEHLGLDPKSYAKLCVLDSKEGVEINDESDLAMSGVNKFNDCSPLSLICNKCKSKTTLSQKIEPKKLWSCDNCHREMLATNIDAIQLSNQLMVIIRRFIRMYYSNIFICRDITCKYICRDLPNISNINNHQSLTKTGEFICPHCGVGIMDPIITHSGLHNQLSFYQFLFSSKETFTKGYKDRLAIFVNQIDKFIKASKYSFVNFEDILSSLLKSKSVLNKMI